MEALDELLKLPTRLDNPYVKEWKESVGYVIGYVCTYVPEEIIFAAGMLPYRVEARGCTTTELADVYMHRFNCTYPRCLLQLGLSGEYDFLDGFCLLNGCEQIRRMYEVWSKYVKTKFLAMVTVPHTITEEGYKWYRDEILNFKESLKGYFAAKLTDDDLRKTIKVYNESRRLIARLYDLRKSEKPPISGTDAFKLITAAFWMPRDKYNHLLKGALDEISQREGVSNYRARVMIGGSACDDPSFIELVEGRGGLVVTDSLCFGSRHFFNSVKEESDPLEAIAKRYYHHNPCPRMLKEYGNRLQFTEKLAKEAKVDGIIIQRISFCDNHGVDSPMLAKDLEAKGIPVLVLEKEYMLSDIGRLKTRIEAFLERIEER